ncbi:unnamed protein product, partial [Ixodes pacificus]
MATVPSSVVTTASIYTTSVPLCQATIENQLCATSTVALPIQVSMPSIVTHTMVQPTSALTGTITVPAVTPTVTPITSTNLGIATACTPVLTTTMVKTAPTSLPERHINTGDGVQVLNKQRLQDLVKEVDPNEQLDDDVEELLLQIADEFIENVVTTSCLLAKHRKSTTLETKDVQLSLAMTESGLPTGSSAADPILPAAHIATPSFKLPAFSDGDAELWFLRVEALFRSHRISSQSSRFDFVVAALPQATAAIVRDILRAPPDNPFDHLKDELIRRTTASEQRRLQQLLTTEELGDRKPTDLLRRMHQLLGDRSDRVEEPIFRELFLQRLPNNVRMILSASEMASTEALACMADRIMEVNTPAIATLTSTTPSSNQAVDRLERLNDVVLQLSRK